MDNPNASDDDWDADNNWDIELDDCIEATQSPEHQDVKAARNFPGLIWPTYSSMEQAEQGLITVTAMETRRNQENQMK